jgi:hypothetical protein
MTVQHLLEFSWLPNFHGAYDISLNSAHFVSGTIKGNIVLTNLISFRYISVRMGKLVLKCVSVWRM